MYEAQLTLTATKARQLAKRLKKELELENLSEAQEKVAKMFGCKDFNVLLDRANKVNLPSDGKEMVNAIVEEIADTIFSVDIENIVHHAMAHYLISKQFQEKGGALTAAVTEAYPGVLVSEIPGCWLNFNRAHEQAMGLAAGILEMLVYQKLDLSLCMHRFEPTDSSGYHMECELCGWTTSAYDDPFNPKSFHETLNTESGVSRRYAIFKVLTAIEAPLAKVTRFIDQHERNPGSFLQKEIDALTILNRQLGKLANYDDIQDYQWSAGDIPLDVATHEKLEEWLPRLNTFNEKENIVAASSSWPFTFADLLNSRIRLSEALKGLHEEKDDNFEWLYITNH